MGHDVEYKKGEKIIKNVKYEVETYKIHGLNVQDTDLKQCANIYESEQTAALLPIQEH